MKVEGRCHCGQITYEAVADPEKVTICHCTDCQMLSGSAYRASVQVPSETFSLRTGQPKVYVKTADSGTRRVQAFCANCGSPVYSSAISDPPTYSLRVGCLRQRAELHPRKQIWCDSALDWAEDLQGLTRSNRQ
jgi:hypothetical protein